MKKNSIVLGLFVLGIALTVSHTSVAYYNDDDGRILGTGILGGAAGATIGGVAGGGKGAVAGGVAGFGIGALVGAATKEQQPRDPYYKLDQLYSKRDSLMHRLDTAKSERKRARIQRSIDRVNADIRSYENRYGIQPQPAVQHRYGMRTR